RTRLAEHRGFCFDSPDAPAHNTESIHHRSVRISAEDGVRIRESLAVLVAFADHPRQVFDVDLMHDAGLGRHDTEIPECGLPPSQEDVALAVTLILNLRIQLERLRTAEVIDLYRMVDHQLDGLKRVDLLRQAAKLH